MYLFEGKNNQRWKSQATNYERINRGRAAITKLNSILWDRDVTLKTKTHIYHAIIKSTIKYAAETWCLKAKTVAKLNFTERGFWRRSTRISRKDKVRNTIIKQTINVTRSYLDDIKYGMDMFREWKRGDYQKNL